MWKIVAIALGITVTSGLAASDPQTIELWPGTPPGDTGSIGEEKVTTAADGKAQTAQGIAWNAIMRRAIALGGVREGLALARMVGMLSYRTPEGLERRRYDGSMATAMRTAHTPSRERERVVRGAPDDAHDGASLRWPEAVGVGVDDLA